MQHRGRSVVERRPAGTGWLAAGMVGLVLLTACGTDSAASSSSPAASGSGPEAGAAAGASPSGASSAGRTPAPGASPAPVQPLDVTTEPQVLATGLEVPWGIAFLPDGDALVSERDSARVLRVPSAGGAPVEVTTLRDTEPGGEGGLLGLAVSPRFATDQLVFAYLTAADDNRIVRFRLDRPAEVTPVLTGIPKGQVHNGGRLAFGPDGMLYAGTGDTGDSDLSQDAGSLGGKVLRMTPDGQPAAGTSLVFSRGHRNVQGLVFDDTGRLFATEFGQNRLDELNELSAGGNYGWPAVEGDEGASAGDGYTAPLVTWDTAEASPSGVALAGGSLWVAALRGERLWQVPLSTQGATGTPVPVLQSRFGRLRAAATAPDGSLWVLTNNRDGRGDPGPQDDRILRLATQ